MPFLSTFLHGRKSIQDPDTSVLKVAFLFFRTWTPTVEGGLKSASSGMRDVNSVCYLVQYHSKINQLVHFRLECAISRKQAYWKAHIPRKLTQTSQTQIYATYMHKEDHSSGPLIMNAL